MVVSVCVPTKDEADIISDFLDMIQARMEESRHELELIVIDSSTDGTADIAAAHPSTDRVIRCEEEGVLYARERGVQEASGDIVVSLDADVFYFKDYFDNLLAPFSEDDDVVMTYGVAGGIRGGRLHEIEQKVIHGLQKLLAPGFSRAFRKEAYYRTGGYDLDTNQDYLIDTGWEEELLLPNKLRLVGKVVYVPEARARASDRTVQQWLAIDVKGGGTDWNFVSTDFLKEKTGIVPA